MSKRKQSSKSKTRAIGRDSIPWRYCILTLCCGLILVVGFFLAARQHFSSIDFGIKNSRLRKQIENLEADKRRLQLAREIALSPAEIKKAAQKIGFREMTASNIEVYRPTPSSAEKPKTIEEKPKQAFVSKPEEIKKEDKKPEKEFVSEKKTQEDKEKKDKVKTQIVKTQIARK